MRQKYGQHFLIDKNIITQIVDVALLLRAQNIVEIGPGKGALTRALVARGLTDFTVIEIDSEMVAYLQKNLPASAGVKIIEQNFLKYDLTNLPNIPTTCISNLPYLYATEILDKVLAWSNFQTAVFMFQKEHAQKIRAKVGDDFYGPLSIFSQLRARISLICKVGRSSFAPPPKVESAVLSFEKITPPDVPWNKLHAVVEAAFLHRRKTFLNALMLSGFDKEKISAILTELHHPLTVRPEQISPDEYVQIVSRL